VRAAEAQTQALRTQAHALIVAALPRDPGNDTDYIFISFVMRNLPRGLVGLLLAVILCAAMSSTASELTALGATTVVDFYRRSFRPDASDRHYLRVAQLFTAGWGVLAVVFAAFASLVDNLIQAVNISGRCSTERSWAVPGRVLLRACQRHRGLHRRAAVGDGGDCRMAHHRRRVPVVQRDRLRGGHRGVTGPVRGVQPPAPARSQRR